MPQQDQSSKMGTSSSPIVNRVIQNSKGGQKPINPSNAASTQFNKKPVKP